jgi:hypothetical protein
MVLTGSDLTSASMAFPSLTTQTIYYWHVVAHTPGGDIQGPYWWFYFCGSLPARVGTSVFDYYDTIQSAYNLAGVDDAYVDALAENFDGDLDFANSAAAITFRGGFSCVWDSNQYYYTTIRGKVTISDGTVAVEKVVIR